MHFFCKCAVIAKKSNLIKIDIVSRLSGSPPQRHISYWQFCWHVVSFYLAQVSILLSILCQKKKSFWFLYDSQWNQVLHQSTLGEIVGTNGVGGRSGTSVLFDWHRLRCPPNIRLIQQVPQQLLPGLFDHRLRQFDHLLLFWLCHIHLLGLYGPLNGQRDSKCGPWRLRPGVSSLPGGYFHVAICQILVFTIFRHVTYTWNWFCCKQLFLYYFCLKDNRKPNSFFLFKLKIDGWTWSSDHWNNGWIQFEMDEKRIFHHHSYQYIVYGCTY